MTSTYVEHNQLIFTLTKSLASDIFLDENAIWRVRKRKKENE